MRRVDHWASHSARYGKSQLDFLSAHTFYSIDLHDTPNLAWNAFDVIAFRLVWELLSVKAFIVWVDATVRLASPSCAQNCPHAKLLSLLSLRTDSSTHSMCVHGTVISLLSSEKHISDGGRVARLHHTRWKICGGWAYPKSLEMVVTLLFVSATKNPLIRKLRSSCEEISMRRLHLIALEATRWQWNRSHRLSE